MITITINIKDDIPEIAPYILDEIKTHIVNVIKDENDPNIIGAGGIIVDKNGIALATYSVDIT